MAASVSFEPWEADRNLGALREELRDFLRSELKDRPPRLRALSWTGFDMEFSRKMAERGWIGMTWPKQYGGHERAAIERYTVLEEVLAAGAPVAAHWIADRQSGPLLLRYGTEEMKRQILPRIASGECFFCIGLSEPGAGSDLGAIRTRAKEVDGGFLVNGTKIWTTNAHRSHFMILFCRTSEAGGDRHAGTSQLLVDLTLPGIDIRPIVDMTGAEDFSEVAFENVLIPREAVIGTIGEGWEQVTAELALERSGPERYLSSVSLLIEMIRVAQHDPSPDRVAAIGRATAQLVILRRLSRSVAGMVSRGENPMLQASIVKDLGTTFEQSIPEIARDFLTADPAQDSPDEFSAVMAHTLLAAPSFSIRGGTREILRGIVARGLGLR